MIKMHKAARFTLSFLCYVLLSVSLSNTSNAEIPESPPLQRKALLIANADYPKNSDFKPLNNPVHDIQLIKQQLIALGFEVKVLPNLKTKVQWETAVRDYAAELGNNTLLLFYYAGHGVQQFHEGKRHDYLLPVQAIFKTPTDIKTSAIQLEWILGVLNDYQPAILMSLIDACREEFITPSNSFFKGSNGFRGMAQRQIKQGVQLQLFSTQAGGMADDGHGTVNSPFALALNQALQQPGKDLYGVANQVMGIVPTLAATNPNGEKQRPNLMQFGQIPDVCLTGGCNQYLPIPANASQTAVLEPQAQITPTPAIVTQAKAIIEPITGMDMIWIEPGEFMMGSPSGFLGIGGEDGRYKDETQHKVILSQGFYLGKHEVTQGQWQKVMGNNPSHFKDCGSTCPVEQISWDGAQSFIQKLNSQTDNRYGYRLPTEAEWEYACRSGKQERYCGGEAENTLAWYWNNSDEKTHPVGQKASNHWGLYDMSGNVWEWVQDWYDYDYPNNTVTDPQGASGGSYRVGRGGSWRRSARYLRAAARSYNSPGAQNYNLGFRLARTR